MIQYGHFLQTVLKERKVFKADVVAMFQAEEARRFQGIFEIYNSKLWHSLDLPFRWNRQFGGFLLAGLIFLSSDSQVPSRLCSFTFLFLGTTLKTIGLLEKMTDLKVDNFWKRIKD